jgi:hypothetical protein
MMKSERGSDDKREKFQEKVIERTERSREILSVKVRCKTKLERRGDVGN